MAKKLTQAQKIRNYREKNPKASLTDIAKALGVRYQSVHQVLRPRVKMIDMTQHADGSITEKVTTFPLHFLEDKPADNVNHPAHYKVGGIETIDFIEAKSLNYHLGNVVKYITRADHKSDRYEDLCKARWYLNREIARLTGAK